MLQFYLQLLDTEEEQRDDTLLYETYRKLMHWIAKRILYDEGLAEDAVQEALKQIVDKKYDAELVALGVPQERIRHYGFAFAGKNVLIGA